MRICTYNIHAGADSDRKPSIPAIIKALRVVNADIILLQEVDRYLLRSGYCDQARIIGRALQREPYFYGRLGFAWIAFGNAILVKDKPVEVRRLALPSSGGEPRCAICVKLEIDGGAVVSTWNTHLGLDSRWRKTQLDALAACIGHGSNPVLVGGDFNARIDEDEVRAFLGQAGLTPVTGSFPTFPVPNPTSQIDFIFARGFAEIGSGTKAALGSDHCLLWSEIERTDPAGLT